MNLASNGDSASGSTQSRTSRRPQDPLVETLKFLKVRQLTTAVTITMRRETSGFAELSQRVAMSSAMITASATVFATTSTGPLPTTSMSLRRNSAARESLTWELKLVPLTHAHQSVTIRLASSSATQMACAQGQT